MKASLTFRTCLLSGCFMAGAESGVCITLLLRSLHPGDEIHDHMTEMKG